MKSEFVRIGPHPFWRWAVAPASGNGIPGLGFMTKRQALRVRAEIARELPPPHFELPVLLKRTGLRSCEEVDE